MKTLLPIIAWACAPGILAGCAATDHGAAKDVAEPVESQAAAPSAGPRVFTLEEMRQADPVAAGMIADVDAAPPAHRPPHWDTTRALMIRRPPRVGEPAPDFTLPSRDGKDTVHLAALRADKPVVLVFGSWT